MTDTATKSTIASNEEPWWKATWPLDGPMAMRLLVGLVAVIIVYSLAGELLTNWAAPNDIVDLDRELAVDLAEDRTETNNSLAHWGSFIADTPVKIGLSAALAAFMLWRWKRWHEAFFVGVTLIFEASAYLASSLIIGRPRPDVERLLESPVATSFPSGHVAAATVYGALAIIVIWHTRSVAARVAAVLVAAALPVIVGIARMYQGMHFLSDVVAGTLLGVTSLAVCYWALGPPGGFGKGSTDDAVALP